MENIFKLAEDNNEQLKAGFVSAELQCREEGRGEAFDQFIEFLNVNGKLSYNIGKRTILYFLDKGYLQNIHERFKDENEKREHLGIVYADVRLTFEYGFENGKKFNYLAINTGNAGLQNFGPYSLIFNFESNYQKETAVLVKNNSLMQNSDGVSFYYFITKGEIDIEKLQKDLALPGKRDALICIKHIADIETSLSGSWPGIICKGKNNYLEVITTNQIMMADVKEVRYPKKRFMRLLRNTTNPVIDGLDESDNSEDGNINSYNEVLNILNSRRIPLIKV